MNAKYKVRNFGNDKECSTLDQLIEVLGNEYLGKQVSIQHKMPSGVCGVVFVDVMPDGKFIDTYKRTELDLSCL